MKLKRTLALLLALVMAMSAVPAIAEAITEEPNPYYAAPEEVTIESITRMNTPRQILSLVAGYRIDMSYTGSESLDDAEIRTVYSEREGILYCTQSIDYDLSHYAHLMFSNDPRDPAWYYAAHTGNEIIPTTTETLDSSFDNSALAYEQAAGTEGELVILSAEETEGLYTVVIEYRIPDPVQRDTLTIDPATGFVLRAETLTCFEGEEGERFTQLFTYDAAIEPDLSPKEAATAASERPLCFSTTVLNGNAYTQEDIRGAKIVMINLFEAWCGPCVSELPDLEKLYETYRDQGLLILGVYSDSSSEEDVRALVEKNGISYPVLRADDALAGLCTRYVPTTRFFTGDGYVLVPEPLVGAKSYESWEKIILGLLADN